MPTLVADSFETSHPISVEVNEPNEISAIFDAISYDKGACITRMMNAFMTEKSFKQGVSVSVAILSLGLGDSIV